MKELSNPSMRGGHHALHSSSTDPSCGAPQTTPTSAGVTTLLLLRTATRGAGGRSDSATAGLALPQIPAGKDSENYLGMS